MKSISPEALQSMAKSAGRDLDFGITIHRMTVIAGLVKKQIQFAKLKPYGPVEIVALPSYKMVMFHSFLYVYQKVAVNTGVGKCLFLGILNITFKYLLEFISPIVG